MKIQERILLINGAPLEGVNPLPKFRERKPATFPVDESFPDELKIGLGVYTKVLPYLVQDRYSRKRIPLKLKCFVLENKYIKAEFLPEYGGRLHSLYDKISKKDLVLRNTVIQPGNLAIRNAWLSGGIEWNIGSFGHTFTTCDNVYCAKLMDDEGNDFIRIYEFERLKSIFWQVDFHLPDSSPYLITHVRMINPFDTDTTTYWWSNTAVPEDGKTRILSSENKIISFVSGQVMKYETLPTIDAMPNTDVSYPSNSKRAFDYFIQSENSNACTWEAAIYKDGVTLFERSTPPLTCKKLFCWGNHFAGQHWQEFLSERGKGYYAEIQAGIAPSQLHDKKIGKGETLEWTQCFGGLSGNPDTLHSNDYEAARKYLGDLIDKRLSAESILSLDKKMTLLADKRITEKDIVHMGSGFGALEIMRIRKSGENTKIPDTMCFPAFSIGKNEAPWKYLLENGVMCEEDPRFFTPTYTTSDKWLKIIEDSLKKKGGKNWYSLMQYGVSVYEGTRLDVYATESYTEEDSAKRTAIAESAWLESIKLKPTFLVYRNLAILEKQRGNIEKAKAYYESAMKCDGVLDDFALLSEYLNLLIELEKYDDVWNLYNSAPENCKSADRIRITVSKAALKLNKFDYLEVFFKEEHYDIREGENPLTDIWFEYNARRIAVNRGEDFSDNSVASRLMEEAVNSCPPPYEIDFRMSLDKNIEYRINQ